LWGEDLGLLTLIEDLSTSPDRSGKWSTRTACPTEVTEVIDFMKIEAAKESISIHPAPILRPRRPEQHGGDLHQPHLQCHQNTGAGKGLGDAKGVFEPPSQIRELASEGGFPQIFDKFFDQITRPSSLTVWGSTSSCIVDAYLGSIDVESGRPGNDVYGLFPQRGESLACEKERG
jgi:hypothetical protein